MLVIWNSLTPHCPVLTSERMLNKCCMSLGKINFYFWSVLAACLFISSRLKISKQMKNKNGQGILKLDHLKPVMETILHSRPEVSNPAVSLGLSGMRRTVLGHTYNSPTLTTADELKKGHQTIS